VIFFRNPIDFCERRTTTHLRKRPALIVGASPPRALSGSEQLPNRRLDGRVSETRRIRHVPSEEPLLQEAPSVIRLSEASGASRGDLIRQAGRGYAHGSVRQWVHRPAHETNIRGKINMERREMLKAAEGLLWCTTEFSRSMISAMLMT
jgi:hypothetical protein